MSRQSMIAEMMKHYPYPKSWYDKLSKERLYSVHQQFMRRIEKAMRDAAKENKENNVFRRYNNETGQWMVLTDIHGWEPESN